MVKAVTKKRKRILIFVCKERKWGVESGNWEFKKIEDWVYSVRNILNLVGKKNPKRTVSLFSGKDWGFETL